MTLARDVLTFDDLCRAAAVSPQWVRRCVREGLLPLANTAGAEVESAEAWRFEVIVLQRVRVMRRLERDFDAVPELAALVADLHDEIHRLRARLRRVGLD